SWPAPLPLQSRTPSRTQGFFSLSLLPGGRGTRFQSARLLAASRSDQPDGSASRALLVSFTSPAPAGGSAAASTSRAPNRYRRRLAAISLSALRIRLISNNHYRCPNLFSKYSPDSFP